MIDENHIYNVLLKLITKELSSVYVLTGCEEQTWMTALGRLSGFVDMANALINEIPCDEKKERYTNDNS